MCGSIIITSLPRQLHTHARTHIRTHKAIWRGECATQYGRICVRVCARVLRAIILPELSLGPVIQVMAVFVYSAVVVVVFRVKQQYLHLDVIAPQVHRTFARPMGIYAKSRMCSVQQQQQKQQQQHPRHNNSDLSTISTHSHTRPKARSSITRTVKTIQTYIHTVSVVCVRSLF